MAEAFFKSEAIAYFDDTKKVSGVCEFYDSQIIIRDNDQTEKKTFDVADYEDVSVVMETKKGFFSKKYCINISSNSLNRNFLILCYKSIENAELCKTTIEKKIKETATINTNNKKYAEACDLLKKDSKESIENAIKTFDTISFWKNSKDLIKQGKDRLNEINNDELYFEALSLIKKAEKSLLKADYEEAISRLNKIKNWKDSNEQLSKCQTKLNEIIEKENKEKQEKYDAAILLAKEDTVESLEKAIKQLPEDWKDSKTLLQTFQKRIADIKEAQENERKQKSYDAAMIEAKKDTISSYEKAIRVLSSILGWKDSEQLIKAFNKRIDEIRIEEENARKEQTYIDALKIASGKTVKDQEKAIKLFSDIIDWKDSKEQIEKCKKAKKHIEEAAFYNKIDEVINSSKQEADNHDKYSSNIKNFKSALTLVLNNPYFILGIACTSEQNKMLDVKDKIEKFARLKLSDGYKSTFDIKNVVKPSRDISNIQAAIVAAKDISAKWLWFETDKYCSWWDKDEIFTLYEKEMEDNEYDLVLACFLNRLICDPAFTDNTKWNSVFASVERLLKLPKKDLLSILKKHIGNTTLKDDEIIPSFNDTIIKPITLLFESSTKEQITNFAKIKVPKVMAEAISSAIVLNVTNLCYPLDIYVKEVENDKTKTDIDKLLSLIKSVEDSVYKNISSFIGIVGKDSTYAKRIKKKYKDAIWNSTNILNSNNLKNKSIPFIKEIYDYCDEGDKQRLRNTYGYDKLGLSEDDLTAGEMNDIAIDYLNKGNKVEGVRLLKKAAENGDSNAQSNLAFRYFDGSDGVPQNKSTAKLWWLKAAAQGNSTAQEALDNLFQIPHEHYDLDYVYIGYGEKKYVEVALNLIAYVRVMDDYNYRQYINGGTYNYYGGYQTQTPARVGIPSSGHWHVVVDNDGDPMGAIQSLSCYTKTISNSYY